MTEPTISVLHIPPGYNEYYVTKTYPILFRKKELEAALSKNKTRKK